MDSKKPDLKQLRFAKVRNTQEPYSENTGLMSRSTQTLETLQESDSNQMDFLDLMSSPQVFPAKTYPLLEPEKGLTESAVAFGQRSPDLLATYDHDGYCWKTLQHCLDGGWAELSETWPQSGMTVNGKLYRHRPSAHLTGDSVSSLLPTIGASEYKGSASSRYSGSKNFRGAKMSEGLRTSQTDAPCTHPNFAEAAMGYPKDYTLLETPSSRKSPK